MRGEGRVEGEMNKRKEKDGREVLMVIRDLLVKLHVVFQWPSVSSSVLEVQ